MLLGNCYFSIPKVHTSLPPTKDNVFSPSHKHNKPSKAECHDPRTRQIPLISELSWKVLLGELVWAQISEPVVSIQLYHQSISSCGLHFDFPRRPDSLVTLPAESRWPCRSAFGCRANSQQWLGGPPSAWLFTLTNASLVGTSVSIHPIF